MFCFAGIRSEGAHIGKYGKKFERNQRCWRCNVFIVESNLAAVCSATFGQHRQIVLSDVCAFFMRPRNFYVVSLSGNAISEISLKCFFFFAKSMHLRSGFPIF